MRILLSLVTSPVIGGLTLRQPPAAPAPEPAAVVAPIDVRLGKVIAINHNTFTLKNESDVARYEKTAVEIYYPAWVHHFPGMQYLLCKGDRGGNEGKYGLILNFNNIDRRNGIDAPDAASQTGTYLKITDILGIFAA